MGTGPQLPILVDSGTSLHDDLGPGRNGVGFARCDSYSPGVIGENEVPVAKGGIGNDKSGYPEIILCAVGLSAEAVEFLRRQDASAACESGEKGAKCG